MNRLLDFSTPQLKEEAVADFKSLLVHPGWIRFRAIMEENIEKVKEQILSGSIVDEDLDTIKRLRDRLRIHTEAMKTPETMIDRLQPPTETANSQDDPYDLVETEEPKS